MIIERRDIVELCKIIYFLFIFEFQINLEVCNLYSTIPLTLFPARMIVAILFLDSREEIYISHVHHQCFRYFILYITAINLKTHNNLYVFLIKNRCILPYLFSTKVIRNIVSLDISL